LSPASTNRRRRVGGFYAYDSTTKVKRVGSACSGMTDEREAVRILRANVRRTAQRSLAAALLLGCALGVSLFIARYEIPRFTAIRSAWRTADAGLLDRNGRSMNTYTPSTHTRGRPRQAARPIACSASTRCPPPRHISSPTSQSETSP
jgi:hypothetical protein